jgi:hypothetical protein
MKRHITAYALLALATAVGCDAGSQTVTTSAPPPTVAVPPPPPAPPQPNPPLVNATGDGTTTVPPGTSTEVTSPETGTQQPAVAGGDTPASGDPNTETVKAEAGVGIKGRSLDEYEGVVVTPVKAYFLGKERIFFDIEFPKNLQIHTQLEGPPQSFAELKEKVIDAYQMKLPDLPAGHRYDFDVEKQELVVVRPKRKSE